MKFKTSNAIIIKNGKVLAGKRAMWKKYYPGYWDVIGGRVEKGEDLSQALKREVMEEVGLKVFNGKRVGTLDTYNCKHYYFLVDKWRGKPKKNHEFSKIEWLDKKSLAKNMKYSRQLKLIMRCFN